MNVTAAARQDATGYAAAGYTAAVVLRWAHRRAGGGALPKLGASTEEWPCRTSPDGEWFVYNTARRQRASGRTDGLDRNDRTTP